MKRTKIIYHIRTANEIIQYTSNHRLAAQAHRDGKQVTFEQVGRNERWTGAEYKIG